jgi:magnesium-transporting ATPase (P-type)
MVTGDNLDTAKAIAIEAGILRKRDLDNRYACMEGKQFREAIGGLRKLENDPDNGFIKEEVVDMVAFKEIASEL